MVSSIVRVSEAESCDSTALLYVRGISMAAARSRPSRLTRKRPKTKIQKPKSKFTVGKDTTYGRPKDKDGFIDYEAALNERMGKGVKPDENAVVLLWQALGLAPGRANMPAEFFKRLGVPAAGTGRLPHRRANFAKERLKINDEDKLSEVYAHQAPGREAALTAKQYPNIAAWLAANEKPLAVAIEAN